jgi:hypothetical protein
VVLKASRVQFMTRVSSCVSHGDMVEYASLSSTHAIISLVTAAEGLLKPSFELLEVNVAVVVAIRDSALRPWEVADIAGPDDLLSIHGADRQIRSWCERRYPNWKMRSPG